MNAWNGQPVDVPLFLSSLLYLCKCVLAISRLLDGDVGYAYVMLMMITVSRTTSWEQKMVIFLVERRERFFGQMEEMYNAAKIKSSIRCKPSPIASILYPFSFRFLFHFVTGFVQFCLLELGYVYFSSVTQPPLRLWILWIRFGVCIVSSVSFHRQIRWRSKYGWSLLKSRSMIIRTFIAFARATALLNSPANTMYVDIYGSMNVSL